MKFRVENVAAYKKVIAAICSIPSVRKQLNGVEQCIELLADEDEGIIKISTVDLTSHAVCLTMPVEVIESGRQVVLSNKIKGLTARLNPKYGLVVSNENNLINYTAKPFGTIVDDQYFSQDSELSKELFTDPDWKEVTPELGFFMALIPQACAHTYNDREIYITTDPGIIRMYLQISETSYVRYSSNTNTLATISDFRAAVRPALLKILQMLGEDVDLEYCPERKLIKFSSDCGTVVILVDNSKNKTALRVDSIIKQEADAYVEIGHEDLSESLKFQSYNTTDTDVAELGYDLDESCFTLRTNELNDPSQLAVTYSGEFTKTMVSVGHLTKAVKAIGSPKNKILPVDVVKINLKKIPVRNANPITAVHLCPEAEFEVTSDIVMYEASC